MADQDDRPAVTDKPKKKRINGRKRELLRDEKRQNHVTGPPCNCSKLRRFEVTTAEDRDIVIRHFSNLKTKDEQDALLASLVSVHAEEVGRRIDNKLSSINVHLNIMSTLSEMGDLVR